jgi:hypothetical protein
MMADEKQIPLHRRFGLRLLQFLLVVFALLLMRYCVILVMNSNNPGLKMQREYYNKGYEAGKQKALQGRDRLAPSFPDLLLERKYRDGYRDGWDATQQEDASGP